jgi:hypothetical protein
VDINTHACPENPVDSKSYFLRQYKLTPIVFAGPLPLRDLPLPAPNPILWMNEAIRAGMAGWGEVEG